MTLKELLDYVKENNVPEDSELIVTAEDGMQIIYVQPNKLAHYHKYFEVYYEEPKKPETTIGIGKL